MEGVNFYVAYYGSFISFLRRSNINPGKMRHSEDRFRCGDRMENCGCSVIRVDYGIYSWFCGDHFHNNAKIFILFDFVRHGNRCVMDLLF